MNDSEKFRKKVIDFLSTRVKYACTLKERVYSEVRELLPCELIVVEENTGEKPAVIKMKFGVEVLEIKFFWTDRTDVQKKLVRFHLRDIQ